MGDREGDAALGGAVELGEDDPGDVDRLGEQARLLQAVLAGRGVDREQHLVRRAGDALGDHAVDLAQLLHQVALGVQAPGGVDDDHVAAARLGRRHGVEGDRRRVAARLRRDEVGAGPLRPRLELLARGGPEGVAGADHARAAGLAQVPGDLADRGRLAGAVHPAHEQHRGMRRDVDAGVGGRRHQLGDDLLQPRAQLVGGREPARVGVGLEPLDHGHRRRHAAVGQEQRLFEPLPNRLVGRVEHDARELLGHRPAAARQVLAQTREQAPARPVGLVGGGVALAGIEHRLPRPRHGRGW